MLASADVRHALSIVDATFERRLSKPDVLCASCFFSKQRAEPEEWKRIERFDAIVREYRQRRLNLPIRAIWDESMGHGPAIVHCSARRLAWFVPSIVAASLDGEDFAGTLRRLAGFALDATDGERTYHANSPEGFSQPERDVLTTFLCAVLASLVTSGIAAADDVGAVFLAALSCGCAIAPLVEVLTSEHAEKAVLALIEQLHDLDPTWTRTGNPTVDIETLARDVGVWSVPRPAVGVRVLRDALFTSELASLLEARFLTEQDPARRDVLSVAEQTIRQTL